MVKLGPADVYYTGMSQGLKIWGACSNAARRCCPAVTSDLPKSGGAAAPPLATCLPNVVKGPFDYPMQGRRKLPRDGWASSNVEGGTICPLLLV